MFDLQVTYTDDSYQVPRATDVPHDILSSIGSMGSEEKMFESVDRR